MGKRRGKRSQGSCRTVNPADLFRKQEKEKQKKKNLRDRQKIREEANAEKDPSIIRDELANLKKRRRLDNASTKRLEQLQEIWDKIQPRMAAAEIRFRDDMHLLAAEEEIVRRKQAMAANKIFEPKKKTSESSSSDSDSSDDSSDSDDDSSDTESESTDSESKSVNNKKQVGSLDCTRRAREAAIRRLELLAQEKAAAAQLSKRGRWDIPGKEEISLNEPSNLSAIKKCMNKDDDSSIDPAVMERLRLLRGETDPSTTQQFNCLPPPPPSLPISSLLPGGLAIPYSLNSMTPTNSLPVNMIPASIRPGTMMPRHFIPTNMVPLNMASEHLPIGNIHLSHIMPVNNSIGTRIPPVWTFPQGVPLPPPTVMTDMNLSPTVDSSTPAHDITDVTLSDVTSSLNETLPNDDVLKTATALEHSENNNLPPFSLRNDPAYLYSQQQLQYTVNAVPSTYPSDSFNPYIFHPDCRSRTSPEHAINSESHRPPIQTSDGSINVPHSAPVTTTELSSKPATLFVPTRLRSTARPKPQPCNPIKKSIVSRHSSLAVSAQSANRAMISKPVRNEKSTEDLDRAFRNFMEEVSESIS